jgi:hypothetical protein
MANYNYYRPSLDARSIGLADPYGRVQPSATSAFSSAGGISMDPATAFLIAQGVGTVADLWSSRGQNKQAVLDRAAQQNEFNRLFKRTDVWREEDIRRQEEAIRLAAEQYEAQQAIAHADWRNIEARRMPNIAASRAILGSTMQTDVPAFRPRYSEAEGVAREQNPYADYIYQGPRSI